MASSRAYRPLDADYPADLRYLAALPDPLFVRGALPLLPGVAIVGTRAATTASLAFARRLARGLAERGIAVWSGGAFGIDAAAHEGAMDAVGPTVVVVGTGLAHCYPQEHAPLYDRIVARGGALVSPFSQDQPPTQWTFLRRNAVLAAMTRLTIVVEAPARSGALATARAARTLGRPIFVVPYAPWDARGAGNVAELGRGASLLLGVDDILRRLRDGGAPVAPPRPAPRARDPSRTEQGEQRRFTGACATVLAAVGAGARHLDELCDRTGLPPASVHQALLTLTLEAVLVEGPAGSFRRVTS